MLRLASQVLSVVCSAVVLQISLAGEVVSVFAAFPCGSLRRLWACEAIARAFHTGGITGTEAFPMECRRPLRERSGREKMPDAF